MYKYTISVGSLFQQRGVDLCLEQAAFTRPFPWYKDWNGSLFIWSPLSFLFQVPLILALSPFQSSKMAAAKEHVAILFDNFQNTLDFIVQQIVAGDEGLLNRLMSEKSKIKSCQQNLLGLTKLNIPDDFDPCDIEYDTDITDTDDDSEVEETEHPSPTYCKERNRRFNLEKLQRSANAPLEPKKQGVTVTKYPSQWLHLLGVKRNIHNRHLLAPLHHIIAPLIPHQ